MPNQYISLISAIIKEQEKVIGPIAWIQAQHIDGLVVGNHDIQIKGDGKKILENLVNQYATLFGPASVAVCRDAVRKLISQNDKTTIPAVLL